MDAEFKRVKERLDNAYKQFNEAITTQEIDCAIYGIRACEIEMDLCTRDKP